MEKQDILDYVSKTPENVNVNVLDGMLDELASGGGGSNDFSIAHVTLINTSQDKYVSFLTVRVKEDYIESYEGLVEGSQSITLDVILYKGKQYMTAWEWDTSIAPVITGDITHDIEENLFIITGDGSISLAGTGSYA